MKTTDEAQKGYVYILTNPSFREDWVKIGKSSRPVDVRSRELDNTAVPLPFEIYATLQCSSYDKVEGLLHNILGNIAGKRIRNNREFFNVKPEDALEAFKRIADILPDAKVFIQGIEEEKPRESKVPLTRAPQAKKKRDKNYTVVQIKSYKDELPKNVKVSWNGTDYYSMAEFVPLFVKQYTKTTPLTFRELQQTFPNEWLKGNFSRLGLIVKLDDITNSPMKEDAKDKSYRYHDGNLIFESKDHIKYCVSNQWTRETFKNVLRFAFAQGYPLSYRVKK